jgi:hypothetical protein
MHRRLLVIGFALGLAWSLPSWGQKATEIFIPIGKSPGVSGVTSAVGTIVLVNAPNRTLTIRSGDAEHSARLTHKTMLWLDNSQMKARNTKGSWADLRTGRLCEVKYVYRGQIRTDEAEWVKVRVMPSE